MVSTLLRLLGQPLVHCSVTCGKYFVKVAGAAINWYIVQLHVVSTLLRLDFFS